MTYVLPDLPYDYAALEPHISAETLELHHDKHHAAYVNGANTAMEQLADRRHSSQWGDLVGLQSRLAFNVSGHQLHSLYWTNLTPHASPPSGDFAEAVTATFGSVDALQRHMTQASLLVQGSGWGALTIDPESGELQVEQILNHQDNVLQGALPLLVIDVWEHAYYLSYRNARAPYLAAIWEIIDWVEVARRWKVATRVEHVLA